MTKIRGRKPGRPRGQMARQSPNRMFEFLPLLYDALAEPMGLLLRCNDPEKLRNQLTHARKFAGDQDLEILQFRHIIIDEGNFVICRRENLSPGPSGRAKLAREGKKGLIFPRAKLGVD